MPSSAYIEYPIKNHKWNYTTFAPKYKVLINQKAIKSLLREMIAFIHYITFLTTRPNNPQVSSDYQGQAYYKPL